MKKLILILLMLVGLVYIACFSSCSVSITHDSSDSTTYKVYRGEWTSVWDAPLDYKTGDITPIYIPLDIDTVFITGDVIHVESTGYYNINSNYRATIGTYLKTIKVAAE